MSFQSHATPDTTLLLGDLRQADQSRSRERFKFPAETLLIPVALATQLAALIPTTTVIALMRQVVCRFWNKSHSGLVGGSIPPELCDAPEIEQYFAIVIATLEATEGGLAMAGCGILSRISSQYGRKPALLLVLTAGIVGNSLIPGSQYTPDWLADWVFFTGMLLKLLSSILLFSYLVNMYIVDVCIPEDRTAALSKMGGWAALGICISYVLGGSITTKTGNPLIVFYMAAAIYLATFIYVVFVLPESFPEERRNALCRMRREHSMDGILTTYSFIFEPLRMLIPTSKLDGTRNWRLAWCAAHNFVFAIASAHISTAWLVFVTSKYGLTPADTGLFLAVVTISSIITLVLIVPPLVRFLRPHYSRKLLRPLSADEDMSDSDELEMETSDHLDVHLAFASCVISAIFYLSAAASTTNQTLIFSGIWIGTGALHAPTIRSLAVGSVDPLKQGEALAAIEIVSNAACVLSPIIMGGILTATINTTPLLVFYVHLVVVLISSALLFLVRDADRYQKLHEG